MSTRKDGIHHYPPLFKAEILNRVQNGELVSKIAAERKVHYSTIYEWMKQKSIKPQHINKSRTRGKKALAETVTKGSTGKPYQHGNVRDAMIYLRHAKTQILKEVGNRAEMSRSQLLTLLALDALQGE